MAISARQPGAFQEKATPVTNGRCHAGAPAVKNAGAREAIGLAHCIHPTLMTCVRIMRMQHKSNSGTEHDRTARPSSPAPTAGGGVQDNNARVQGRGVQSGRAAHDGPNPWL